MKFFINIWPIGGMAFVLTAILAGGAWAQERGVDYFGGDYRSLGLPVMSREQGARWCQARCDEDARCKAYTYLQRSNSYGGNAGSGRRARCYLKSGSYQRRSNRCCISGRSQPDVAGKIVDRNGFSIKASYRFSDPKSREPIVWNNAVSPREQYLQAPNTHRGNLLARASQLVGTMPRLRQCQKVLSESGAPRIRINTMKPDEWFCLKDHLGQYWRLHITEIRLIVTDRRGANGTRTLIGIAERWHAGS